MDHAKYKAYLSYSHRDERWAQWLQRALERYRVPERLRKRTGGALLPQRLHPIFRDRDELASAANLPEAIQYALANSEALIVICSPAAANSRWVNEEIRLYKASGRADRVFCLVVDGRPTCGEVDSAFPPAILLSADGSPAPEPLAADLTPNGDGKRNAMLKIAAGLLGVGVDDLKHRDAQRRARVWSGVAAASFAITAITVALAVTAHFARVEADLRRGQAEGLIGFMLGDLRSRLEPIGKLDVLDAVGDQAMRYFGALGDFGSEPEALARAKALRQIGEVRLKQGRLEPALQSFEESLKIAKQLHESTPTNDEHLFELGQAEFWVGYVAWERKDLVTAYASMQRYLEHGQELLRRDGANPVYLLELEYALSNLGSIARARGDAQTALDHFKAVAALQETALRDPQRRAKALTELVETQSLIGSTLLDLGRLQDSEDAFEEAVELVYANRAAFDLEAAPMEAERYASVVVYLSEVHMLQGEVDQALNRSQESRAVFEGLVRHDPTNAIWRRHLLFNALHRATLIEVQKRPADSDALLASAAAGFQELVTLEPTRMRNRQSMTATQRLQARAALARRNAPEALRLAKLAHLSIEDVIAEATASAELTLEAARTAEVLGAALHACGYEDDARRVWVQASERLRREEGVVGLAVRRQLAIQRSDEAETRTLGNMLTAIGFNDPRFEPSFATFSGDCKEQTESPIVVVAHDP